jgi:glucose/arabinose dehydrogenase
MRFFLLVLLLVAVALAQDLPIHLLKVPQGFNISVFARIPGARQISVTPDERYLFAGSFNEGAIYALALTNGKLTVLAKNLTMPVGVTYDPETGHLFATAVGRVLRFDSIVRYLDSGAPIPTPYEIRKYPTDTWHGWKYIKIKGDRVYVPVGSPCNICLKNETIFGSMTSFNKHDGSDFQLHFRGMRNTVGFDWNPHNDREMWWTENGRDDWGNNRPGDELNRWDMDNKDAHFGFPYCYEKDLNDPTFFNGSCIAKGFIPAAFVLAPHAAALGMTFYTGTQFPSAYQGGHTIFIAEHGSWNRDVPIAYRVTQVDIRDPNSYKVFIDGWLQLPPSDDPVNDSKYAWGRPVDVLQLKDGSLLISDDKSGTIYRVKYSN